MKRKRAKSKGHAAPPKEPPQTHRSADSPRPADAVGEPARQALVRSRWLAIGLCLLSVALLAVSFPPFDAWPLAYVGLVPFGLAVICLPRRRFAMFAAYLGGLAFWLVNTYWLSWITPVGYAASAVYLAAYWWIAAAFIRSASRRGVPTWVSLPVIWVALEFARAWMLSGFPWFFLAHSQTGQTRLIQVADVTGTYGVSFFVAMVNGVLIDGFRRVLTRVDGRVQLSRSLGRAAPLGVAISVALMAVMLGYGSWRLTQKTTRPGPIFGVVQEKFPISLAGRSHSERQILRAHLDASARFKDEPVDLVVWPETMLPRGLNAELLTVDLDQQTEPQARALAAKLFGPAVWDRQRFPEKHLRAGLATYIRGGTLPSGDAEPGLRSKAALVGDLSKEVGCPILAGGSSMHANPSPIDDDDHWVVSNSALWFDGHWRSSQRYSKMHLVPFSEYVPFKRSWPAAHKALRWFVPESMDQIEPGSEVRIFELDYSQGRSVRLATPICYEGTIPRVCRRMVTYDGRKQADVLVNMSNDGWFVPQFGEPPYDGSTEHNQHLSMYVYRAIENRVPVVRSVNTGISGLVDSNGRVQAVVEGMVDGERRSRMVSGTLVLDGKTGPDGKLLPGHGPKVLVDERVSLYSRLGDAFALAVSAAATAGAAWLVWQGRRQRKGRRTRENQTR